MRASMPYKKLIFILCALILCGCSVVAYTPVVATSALGLNKTDLSDSPEFRKYTKQPFQLEPLDEVSWQLKKFEGGRYYIGLASNPSEQEVICDLGAESVLIENIFDDSVNGGIFYSARVTCNKQVYNAPLNHWSDQFKNCIKFIENNT